MLQQTQVATVIPYYRALHAAFSARACLAAAPVDEVLHLWSGLGYYARARNLHRAAVRICRRACGRVPRQLHLRLAALPGIGRSTAGAILALARAERFADTRRQRAARAGPLLRCRAGARGSRGEKRLWALAERCTPHAHIAEYTQAIMDLGATVCVRRRPLCTHCPLSARCFARRTGRAARVAGAAAPGSAARGGRSWWWRSGLAAACCSSVRPRAACGEGCGACRSSTTATAAAAFVRNCPGAPRSRRSRCGEIEHAFTHFDLTITPLLVRCAATGRDRGGGRRPLV